MPCSLAPFEAQSLFTFPANSAGNLGGIEQLGHEQRLQAYIVNYADDFVICTRGHAAEALAAMQATLACCRCGMMIVASEARLKVDDRKEGRREMYQACPQCFQKLKDSDRQKEREAKLAKLFGIGAGILMVIVIFLLWMMKALNLW